MKDIHKSNIIERLNKHGLPPEDLKLVLDFIEHNSPDCECCGNSDDEVITAYITKYALTDGIQFTTGTICEEISPYVFQSETGVLFYHGEWHRTLEEAVAHAVKMKIEKIESFKMEIDKLKFINFNGGMSPIKTIKQKTIDYLLNSGLLAGEVDEVFALVQKECGFMDGKWDSISNEFNFSTIQHIALMCINSWAKAKKSKVKQFNVSKEWTDE